MKINILGENVPVERPVLGKKKNVPERKICPEEFQWFIFVIALGPLGE